VSPAPQVTRRVGGFAVRPTGQWGRVNRFWSLSTTWAELDGTRTPPWQCQLVHCEMLENAIVLDLVALEPCPSEAVGCPAYTPFSVHVGRSEHRDESWEQTFAMWALDADLVTIVCGVTDDGSSWLWLSSNDQHLLLQI